DADAADLVGDAQGHRPDAHDRGVERTGVEVQVLDLPRPIARERTFDARTRGPAETAVFRGGADAADGNLELVVDHGGAAGRVDHEHRPERIADAAARREEPRERIGRGGRNAIDGGGRTVVLTGALPVELDTEHPRAVRPLPVVADLAAADDAIGLCVAE